MFGFWKKATQKSGRTPLKAGRVVSILRILCILTIERRPVEQ